MARPIEGGYTNQQLSFKESARLFARDKVVETAFAGVIATASVVRLARKTRELIRSKLSPEPAQPTKVDTIGQIFPGPDSIAPMFLQDLNPIADSYEGSQGSSLQEMNFADDVEAFLKQKAEEE